MMRVPEQEVVEVLNPVREDHTCLRAWLTPSLLAVLRKSKHRDLPQRIFEVGDVVAERKEAQAPGRPEHPSQGLASPRSSRWWRA